MQLTDWTPTGWRPGRANYATAAGLLSVAVFFWTQDGPTVAAGFAGLAVCVLIPAPKDPNPPIRRSAYLGRVVCMECGITIEPAIDARLLDSHGLCNDCRPKYDADFSQ